MQAIEIYTQSHARHGALVTHTSEIRIRIVGRGPYHHHHSPCPLCLQAHYGSGHGETLSKSQNSEGLTITCPQGEAASDFSTELTAFFCAGAPTWYIIVQQFAALVPFRIFIMSSFAVPNLFNVKGKVVLITGGSRGIGKAVSCIQAPMSLSADLLMHA